MRYAHPGSEGAIVSFKARYGNYIGGEFVPPVKGQYFTNTSPVNGQPIAEFPRSTAEDIDKALDAAHAAADAWGRTSVQERSNILLKIADRIEQNLELLAVTETWDNGKAVRETLNADIPRGRRPLPLLRRLHPRPGRLRRRDQRQHRGLPHP
ncbi:acetaldehyde dehydrogenase 2 [Pseudomonas aeruginosa]|nr:acetaldehyde dehydrogenase 2 [Pseudomonas aeruginosa]